MSKSSIVNSVSSPTYLELSRPPDGYVSPEFPSLYWPPQIAHAEFSLYYLYDIWRFTLLWTLILYAFFHLSAAAVAVAVRLVFSDRKPHWSFLWSIPIYYIVVAGFEALFAGSIVGLIVGAAYISGPFWMSTWIPFIWGWANVLVLLTSSFSIQGGL